MLLLLLKTCLLGNLIPHGTARVFGPAGGGVRKHLTHTHTHSKDV